MCGRSLGVCYHCHAIIKLHCLCPGSPFSGKACDQKYIHYSFKKPLWSTTLMLHQGVNLIGQRWLVHNPFHICTGLYWIGWLSLHYSNLKCVDQRG